jgi:peptidoglycan/LPS O-acetylase OafA/YrhL
LQAGGRGVTGRPRDYYHGVDLVRFVSALMVALFHLGLVCWAAPAAPVARILRSAYVLPDLTPWVWFGWVGVQIFFVVSGFVIATSAEGASPLGFFKSRLLRLYPAAWIATTLVLAALVASGVPPSPWAYGASMLLLPTGPWIDGQYWTLGLEIVFYSLVFLLLAIGRFERIGLLAAAMGLASAAYILAVTAYPGSGLLRGGWWQLTLLYFGIYFAIGIFVRLWVLARMTPALWLAAAACLLAAILQTRLHALAVAVALPRSPMRLADYWYVATLVFLAGTAAVMLSARYRASIGRLPPPMLRLARTFGLATYPFYLLHLSIGVVLARALVLFGLPPFFALALTIILLVGAAILVSSVLEKAVRRRLRACLDAAEQRLISPFPALAFLQRPQAADRGRSRRGA